MKDIKDINDIQIMVNTFYHKVKKDTLIGPVFHGAIKDWGPHLNKMYSFWETILLDSHTYNGAPFAPHAKMPIEKLHFDRWILLFEETVNTLFKGDKADEAKWRANKMAQLFNHKIEYFKNASHKPLI